LGADVSTYEGMSVRRVKAIELPVKTGIKVVPRSRRPLLGRFFCERIAMNIDFTRIIPFLPYQFGGIWITLQIALGAAVLGSILGLFLSLGSSAKGLPSLLIKMFVDFFRGTPLLFQLAFFHFGLPQITGFVPTPYTSALVIFSLNSSAYLSEILRAGIESIDKGQREAAQALGVTRWDISWYIIVPQALRNVLPAIMNEFITLVKETSVVSMISLTDIMRRQQIISAATYRYFEPLLIIGVIYLSLNIVLSQLGKFLERKLAYD
jgi:His/Glu/Gln/Arg/opine family amino acid ABC transporter permease subunit